MTKQTALPTAPARSESILRRRFRKFQGLKRGYWAAVTLASVYVVSFFLPVLASNNAIAVRYDGQYYFPGVRVYQAAEFGQVAIGEAN